ncbi:MAG: hypothetical protein JKY65_11890, partial [Planctomycetes bacterium]|nr:hypothetical protein [Planctomycetota bacterium]
HALAAALAARDGSALEVERHLRKHGKPRRAELELLPYLAAARAGRLSEPKARAALDLFEDRRGPTPTELGGLLALGQVVAKKRSEQQVLAESGREAPQLPTWTREKILLELRTPLATTSLAAIVEFGQGLGPECGAVLTQRVSEVLLQDAPRVGQVSLPRARIARVAVAIRAFRTLAPHPHPLPAREGLSAFAAGRITALSSDLAEPVGEEGFDFALALADALPDDALIQSTAGQAIWNARLTSPARWRGLLRVAGRELATVRSQETAIRPRLEAKVLSRLLCLLRGLQEFLPPAARDPKQLERALVVIDRRAQLDPKHALDAPADRAYVRLLLGRLEQSELDALPARNVSPRVKLARLYLAPEELSRVPDLLAALRYVRREVAPGALLHRCGLDLLWPKEGPASPSASAREPYIDQLASALARRNRPYSLHWRIQAARLALPIAPGRCRQKLSRAASLALTAGWTEQSRALNTAASAPTDALLAELADQALELERNP